MRGWVPNKLLTTLLVLSGGCWPDGPTGEDPTPGDSTEQPAENVNTLEFPTHFRTTLDANMSAQSDSEPQRRLSGRVKDRIGPDVAVPEDRSWASDAFAEGGDAGLTDDAVGGQEGEVTEEGTLREDDETSRVVVTPLPVSDCTAREDMSLNEVAQELGVEFQATWVDRPLEMRRDRHVGGGVVVSDLTGDDRPDLLVTSVWGPNALYVNDGTERFLLVDGSGLESLERVLSASALDLTGDGLRDVVLTNWTGVHLFRNLGAGQFAEGSLLLVAPEGERPTFTAWTDFDGDGLVDCYVGFGPACFRDEERNPCSSSDRLLKGLGGGLFSDLSHLLGESEDRSGFALAGGWLDLNEDGYLDVLVGNDSGHRVVPNRVFINPGPSGPLDVWIEDSQNLGLDARMASMGIAFGQVDGVDGMEVIISDMGNVEIFSLTGGADLVSSDVLPEIRYERWRFQNQSAIAAAWGVELEDLDNDGDLDLSTAWGWLLPSAWWEESRTRADLEDSGEPLENTVWLWETDRFVDRSGLLSDSPSSWTWRTVSPVDLDRNGTLDLVFTSLMGPVSIQLNACTPANWLWIELHQGGGNPDALGAKLVLETDSQTQWRRIGLGSTGAHSGREPVAHFGLGSSTSGRLTVTWPDGEITDLGEVRSNQRLRVSRTRVE